MQLETRILVHHFLENSALSYPDKVALVQGEVRAGYSEINDKANRLAAWLIDRGVAPGDRIAMMLENGLDYVIAYYGILKAGAVAAPLSTDLQPEGLASLLHALEPKMMISSAKYERSVMAVDFAPLDMKALIIGKPERCLSSSAPPVFCWDDLLSGDSAGNSCVDLGESSLCSIIYTSGSLGLPKGVMLTHGNIVANTCSIVEYLRLDDADIQMVVLPFFYVMGKSLLNTHFAVGGTVVVNNRFAYPVSVIEQMCSEQVTGFSGVPSTYAYLLYRSPLRECRDKLGSLRFCSQAGGHMSRQVKEELLEALPAHTRMYVMYGATEASARLTYVEPDRLRKKIDSIGRPIPGVTLRVLDESGKEVPAGVTGELVAYGGNIMRGYWKDPLETSRVLDENGYHTGDLGYRDGDGYFYLVGRKDCLLKVGGHRVNPREVEEVLMSTGLLVEAAVVGIPDRLLGYRLAALAAPRDKECKDGDIIAACASKLPRYKLPGEIKLVSGLPKNANGKINRESCLTMASNIKKIGTGRK